MKQSSLLLSHTAVAESFSPTLPPLLKYVTEKLSEKNTARRNWEGITIEICRDACGIQSHRGNSKRSAQVDHAGNRTSVNDFQPVLEA